MRGPLWGFPRSASAAGWWYPWEYHLRPTEFLILSYLCCQQAHNREGKVVRAKEVADEYLPRVLAGILNGKLGALGDRVGRLLFKLAVDDAVMTNLVAATASVDLDTLKKLRARCVREVKETNGQISFEDALKYQKGLE